MSNILYIALIDNNNHYDCMGILSQFKENTLCLFASEDLFNFHHKFVVAHKAKTRVIKDLEISLWNIVKEYSKYELFGFIHNSKIVYYNNNNPIVVNDKIVQIDANNAPLISFFNTKLLIELNRLNSILPNIIHNTILNIDIEKTINYFYTIYVPVQENNSVINRVDKNFKNMYEDDTCAFLTVDSINNIVSSAVFINKRNMKAYHVGSLLAGNVLNLTENSLIIDWQINNESVYCSY
jgi:hypothetical protein